MAELPSFAGPSELEARLLATFTPEQSVRAQAILDDASALIRDAAGWDWVDVDGDLDAVPARITQICVAVAQRAWTNPSGLTQRSIGNYSESHASSPAQGAAVYLTDSEERAVSRLGASAGGRSRVGVVTLASPYGGTVDDLVL